MTTTTTTDIKDIKEKSLWGTIKGTITSVFGATTKSVIQIEKTIDTVDNYSDMMYETSIKDMIKADSDAVLTDEEIEQFYTRKKKLADIRKALR